MSTPDPATQPAPEPTPSYMYTTPYYQASWPAAGYFSQGYHAYQQPYTGYEAYAGQLQVANRVRLELSYRHSVYISIPKTSTPAFYKCVCACSGELQM